MPPKKNEGTTTKNEKSRQVLPLNVSYNDNRPTDRARQWFISEMEKRMQKIQSIIEGELLRKLSVTTKPSGTELGHGWEYYKFNDSSATMQLELNDYKKATKERAEGTTG